MRRIAIVLSSVVIALGATAAADQSPCRQPLATVTVPEHSYANVSVREFDGRVYMYVPEIRTASPGPFAPFQLWIVEGVYGRPFVEPRGRLDDAAFERLRKNRNVRATPVKISRSRETLRVTLARKPFLLDTSVALARSGAGTVTVSLCSPQ